MLRITGVVLLLLVLTGIAGAQAPKNTKPASLAVITRVEAGGEKLAELLGPLLEVEVSQAWDGTMLERAELDTLLKEIQLAMATGNGIQAGKIERAATLISARVSADKVILTVTRFPQAEVVIEKEYRDRLEPESLATRLAADALTAIRAKARDPKLPTVAIGAVYCVDPHQRFLVFSRKAEAEMRKLGQGMNNARMVERLFPSDLLNELNLARAGVSVGQAIDFSAPPADLLIYGECTPQKDQDLKNPAILLDCTLTALSPTGLMPAQTAVFTCRTDAPDTVAAQAKTLLDACTKTITERLTSGTPRNFSTAEFTTFRSVAYRLIPLPPEADGSFRGSCDQWSAQPEVLDRALRMLECALLFNGSDVNLLAATGTVLVGRTHDPALSKPVKEALLFAGIELIERAYRLDANRGTRMVYTSNMWLFPWYTPAMRARVLALPRHIWASRTSEGWDRAYVDASFTLLFREEQNYDALLKLFLDVVPEYRKRGDGFYNICDLTTQMIFRLDGTVPEASLIGLQKVADRMIADPGTDLQGLGHLLAARIALFRWRGAKAPESARAFAPQVRACCDLLPNLIAQYGSAYGQSRYAIELRWTYEYYQQMIAQGQTPDDFLEIQTKDVTAHIKASGLATVNIGAVITSVAKQLRAKGQQQRAISLLSDYLDRRHNVTGDADFERMSLTRLRNLCRFDLAGGAPIAADQLRRIELGDNQDGWWVCKLALTPNGLFALRLPMRLLHGSGEAFFVPATATKAAVLLTDVFDFACAGAYAGFGTGSGFNLVNSATLAVKSYTPKNSALPSTPVKLVCDLGTEFLLGIDATVGNRATIIYRLDPLADRFTETDENIIPLPGWRMKANPAGKPLVLLQRDIQRLAIVDGKTYALTMAEQASGARDYTVRDGEQVLLHYAGFDLNYIMDFTVWKGWLVFASGTGLYVSRPGSNTVQCLFTTPETIFFSVCPAGDQLFLGTSAGLYRLDAGAFTKAVATLK